MAEQSGDAPVGVDTIFHGLKVIDLSGGVAGPYCALMLRQYGADVIKVESPDGGDWARILGTRYGDHTAYSLYCTLGKRSIAIDLKTAEGSNILWRLLDGADVFLEGFRPGAIGRLGFGYEAVRARNPGILYCSISGFGQAGPLASRPAMDPVLQAFIGLIDENRGERDGHPHRMAISAIDLFTGTLAFQALVASLYERLLDNRSIRQGKYLDLSLMQGGAALAAIRLIAHHLEDGKVIPTSMPTGVFETADGLISLTIVRPADWGPFCQALEQPWLQSDPRFCEQTARGRHMAELFGVLRPIFAAKSTQWLVERFTAFNIMNGRVNTYGEFLAEDQVRETGTIAWLEQSDLPDKVPMLNIPGLPAFDSGTCRAHAPTIGEHTVEVLEEHGYSESEISRLLELGAVARQNRSARSVAR